MSLVDLSFLYLCLEMTFRRLKYLLNLPFQSLPLPKHVDVPDKSEDSQVVLVDESTILARLNITLPNWGHPFPLPDPSTVRSHSKILKRRRRAMVVHLEELGLVVKYGSEVHLSEAKSMILVSKTTSLRVPKVYGWYQDQGDTFIFMEYLPGDTLKDCWSALNVEERHIVVAQLRSAVESLRRLRPDPNLPSYIGSLGMDVVHDDILYKRSPTLGPFATLSDFYMAISDIGRSLPSYPNGPLFQTLRDAFPLDAAVLFTHSDLNPVNILVNRSGTSIEVSIIDWAQAGWRPEWWEIWKARWTVPLFEEWSEVYIPLFLSEPYVKILEAMYVMNDTGLLI